MCATVFLCLLAVSFHGVNEELVEELVSFALVLMIKWKATLICCLFQGIQDALHDAMEILCLH